MLVFIMILFVFQPYLRTQEKVVIAIAADGETTAANVSEIAARCNTFLFFDSEGKLFKAETNPYKDNRGSAGVSAAGFLAEREVTLVAAGRFGNKMRDALAAHNIACMEFTGSVLDAIQKILE